MSQYGRARQGRRLSRLGAGGRVECAGARRVPLTCECSSMSCMEHGEFFLFTARLPRSLIYVGSTLDVSRFSVS